MITEINNNIRLSPHFMLSEFLNLRKYPENIPSMQVVVNLTYGCHLLLEPARVVAGPLIINSGFRNPEVNQKVGDLMFVFSLIINFFCLISVESLLFGEKSVTLHPCFVNTR